MTAPRRAALKSLLASASRRITTIRALVTGLIAVARAVIADHDHGVTIPPPHPDELTREFTARLRDAGDDQEGAKHQALH